MNKVFVYGTLRKSHRVRGLDQFPDAEFINNAKTLDKCYNMLNLGAFPAVTCDGNKNIIGEVWNVSDEIFSLLDHIEGYPTFYDRKKINTTEGLSWMYYFKKDTGLYEHVIPHGEFIEWQEAMHYEN